MKVQVTRTSVYSVNKPPCEEAFQEKGEWYVNILSLKDLYKFIGKYRKCVLNEMDGELTIEIYDTYRE